MTARARARRRLQLADRIGDRLLYGLCLLAALLAVAAIVEIAYQLVHGAHISIARNGLGFLTDTTWKPNFDVYGAGVMLFGTAVSSTMALAIATPIGVAIGLYLSMLAPRGVRSVVGPLVEMLAAIPSVILGFWGILVLGPFLHDHLEPTLHSALGFVPLFGVPPTTGSSVFTAGLILAIMVVPIIASISRDLFLTVPQRSPGRGGGPGRHAVGGRSRSRAPVDGSGSRRGGRSSAWAAPWARPSRSRR